MWLPKCNVTHTAYSVYQYLFRALRFQGGNFIPIGGQIFLGGKIPLLRRHGQLAERAVESLRHGILECGRIACGQRISLRVAPFIHVEAIYMFAIHIPLLQEIYRPFIHAHGPDRQNQDQLAPFFFGLLDLHKDFMPHVSAKLFKVCTHHRGKTRMPEFLPVKNRLRGIGNALFDLFKIPAIGQDLAEIGTL